MSYDVYLISDADLEFGYLDANYTCNVSCMFSAAIGETPTAWAGKPASEVRDACGKILEAFASNPAKYRSMNPKNGWGDFEGAREFIRKIQDACADNPDAFVVVS